MKSKLERLQERYDRANDELNHVIDQRDALQATVEKQQAEIDNLVAWVMGDRDALACLQSIYNSATASEANRAKAAAAAIAYERPKPASTTLIVDFRERVRQARLAANAKLIEEAKTRAKVIEHQPAASAPLSDAS